MCPAEPSGAANCSLTSLWFLSPQTNLHTAKLRGERLEAGCALTALHSTQLAGYALYVTGPRLHATPSQALWLLTCQGKATHPDCFVLGHPLTFRNVDDWSNIIALCRNEDIFGLDNPQDVFCI